MSDDRKLLSHRLAAILFADVAGYTRLSEADEAGTHQALTESLDLLAKSVRTHGGDVVHFAGDAILAEFPSVVSALNCAVAMHRELRDQMAQVPPARRIQFRTGINVGDVIVDRDEIYGDGVNAAVRLHTLAEPGGICISEAVRTAIGQRLPVAYEFLGEQTLKNLSTPIRAYRAILDSDVEPVPVVHGEGKPSVAVLPFENLSADPEQAFFADGLTEDLIRELSRFHGIVVIAHSSTFTYKGRAVKVQDIASELDVEFVVEGNVRRAGDQLRVSAELIEASSGHHVWAERYDRHFGDVFEVQDDIVQCIVATIAGRLHIIGGETAMRRSAEHLRVYDYILRGQAMSGRDREANALARTHYERALAHDKRNPRAYAGLALTYLDDWWSGWTDGPAETLDRAIEAAGRAYVLDATDSKVLRVLAMARLFEGAHEEARSYLARAVELNPNDADSFAAKGLLDVFAGELDAARDDLATATRLNPFAPSWYQFVRGILYYAKAELAEAGRVLREALEQNHDFIPARVYLVATYAELGADNEARSEAEELVRCSPGITIERVTACSPYAISEQRERLLEALKAAGLPECGQALDLPSEETQR